MKNYFISFMFIIFLTSAANSQNVFQTTVVNQKELIEFGGDSTGKKIHCEISALQSQQIENDIASNRADLIQRGILNSASSFAPVKFIFPLRKKAGFNDPGFYHIGNYIDKDPAASAILDYNCGTRTYDGHNGTDIGISPFEWNKMDSSYVEVISGADGIIINKTDGNFDRNCSWSNANWNAIYIQHSDGTVAWYGHLKSGSLTIKVIGQSVLAGEYLGAVGSSGMSSGPHLHFELRNSANVVLDPWNGSCNSASSLWLNQEPYYKSGLNKIMTANAPPSTQCSSDTLHQDSTFCAGDIIYLVAGYRDQLNGQTVSHALVAPNNTIYDQWTQSFSGYGAASWWWYSRFLPNPAQAGTWKYRITYLGVTYETTFTVSPTVSASVTITTNNGTSVCSGSSISFNAYPVNPGTSPVYQWKRNGINHGTNSPTYTTSSLTNGTIVTCVMTSNSTAQCFSGNHTVTSNSLNMSVISVATPTLSISQSPAGAINPTSTVTFTAASVHGGTMPQYQWKKNNVIVGNNSANYTNSSWVKGDIIQCVMTSNRQCITTYTATSNAITISTLPKYMTVDIVKNKAYYYDASLTYLLSHTLSSTTLNGVTNASDVIVVGTKAYVLDQLNKRIYRSTATGTLPVTSKTLKTSTGSSLLTPSGLAINGDTLWILDKGNKAIYRYSLSSAFASSGTLNAAAKITLNTSNSNAESLIANGLYFYVLDNGITKKIFRYTKSGSGALASKTLLTNTGSNLSNITGLVLDGSYLRIVDNGLDRTFKYSLSSLFSSTGTLNASSNNLLYSSNTDATGITLTTSSNILKTEDVENSIEEVVDNSFELLVFPNPSSANITVRLEGNITGIPLVQVYDFFGKLIMERKIIPANQSINEEEFDLSMLSSGKYIIRVNDVNTVKTKIIERY